MSLAVQDSGSHTNTFDFTVIAYVPSAPTTLDPVAMFNSTLIANVTKTVKLDGSFSFDPEGGTIVAYSWNFGDGNVTSGAYPTINHVWHVVGNYTVSLTVTDSDSETNTFFFAIRVMNVSGGGGGVNMIFGYIAFLFAVSFIGVTLALTRKNKKDFQADLLVLSKQF